jgi:uncharacterized protein (TIGR02271 family)
MLDTTDIQAVIGQDVYGSDGEKIGSAGQVFLDDESGQPEWVTVQTGLFGTKESFVPVADAQKTAQGLTVPFTKDQVKDAPNVDVDNGHLSLEEEEQLYRHYGRETDYSAWRGSAGGVQDDGDGDRGTVGHDTSGPNTDDAMTRSEERLNVGTESRERGRAKLRKYVVTEEQNVTVPVQREEVTLEREPITDANVDDALSGPDISEEEHEVTLREERPVVETEAVPVERVRLNKETVTEQEQVSGEVRKEQIEAEGDTAR